MAHAEGRCAAVMGGVAREARTRSFLLAGARGGLVAERRRCLLMRGREREEAAGEEEKQARGWLAGGRWRKEAMLACHLAETAVQNQLHLVLAS